VKSLDGLERKLRVIENNRIPPIRIKESVRVIVEPVYIGHTRSDPREVGRITRKVG
jgi:hypothetical protein